MMDEEELELCLDIEPSGKKPSPLNYQKRRHSAAVTGQEREDTTNANTRDQERYLLLPPRKRVKISSPSSEHKEDVQALHEANQAEANKFDPSTTEQESTYLASNGEANTPEKAHGDSKLTHHDIDIERPTLDVNVKTNFMYPPPPQAPDIHPQRRPQRPFVYFPEEAYMPALFDTLPSSFSFSSCSSHTLPTRRSNQFVIFEDPDNMELDDTTTPFEPSWYCSPEDDKENADDALEHRPTTSEPEYQETRLLTSTEIEHLTRLRPEHHAYFTTANFPAVYPHPHSTINRATQETNDNVPHHPQMESTNPWLSTTMRPPTDPELDMDATGIEYLDTDPADDAAGADTPDSLIVSASSLSATEMSLHALPQQALDGGRGLDSFFRSRYCPQRIRSVNFS